MAFDHILTRSSAMPPVLQAASHIAATDVSVLITGESGTGKEIMARAIHDASPRNKAAFVTINCAALPDNLAESLLFGHRKGSFTGADQQHVGLIAAADQGTLFLDEIGELSPALQAKLLRFLESGEILPLGEVRTRRVNVRVLAATHCDLYRMTCHGSFRTDLYYRLNVVPLQLPTLRERPEDIALLTEHFLGYFASHHRLAEARPDPETLRRMAAHPWPGNIRELRNTCERLSILMAGCIVKPQHLDQYLPDTRQQDAATRPATDAFQLPSQGVNLEALEKDLLTQALQLAARNKTQAAGLLGISRDALNYRLKKHALA
ncbi:MAG TPA: sigma-54 dependent transcriptional regulator [Thiolinea sp.]|nr:sigma-54 dependent transcriptional regulator [Thiolinea sp.]